MNKLIHTYHYKKLINGTRPYKNIRFRFWLWGFGVAFESKTVLKGFAINSRAYETKADIKPRKK